MTDTIDIDKQLATLPGDTRQVAIPSAPASAAPPAIKFKELVAMAGYIEQCGLYGIKTLQQTVSIMLMAQAMGQHPVLAARDYHLLTFTDKKTGKSGCMPTLKADIMLGYFLEAGGSIEYIDYTPEKVTMRFTWRNTSLAITWDLDRAKQAGLLNDMYNKYPQQMLKARCIGEGVKAVCPQVTMGMYTTEEATQFLYDDIEPPKPTLKEPIQIKPKHDTVEATQAAAQIDSTAIEIKEEDLPPITPAPPLTIQPSPKPKPGLQPKPDLSDENYPKIDSINNFKSAARILISKVQHGKLDKETAKRHYFVFCEELALLYEEVPEAVTKSIEANLY